LIGRRNLPGAKLEQFFNEMNILDARRQQEILELSQILPPPNLVKKGIDSLDEAILTKENIVHLIERVCLTIFLSINISAIMCSYLFTFAESTR
jgi:hypothetical protein